MVFSSISIFAQGSKVSFSTPVYTLGELQDAEVPDAPTRSTWKFEILRFGTPLSVVTQNYERGNVGESAISKESARKARDAVALFLNEYGMSEDVVNPLLDIRGMRTERVWAREVETIFSKLNKGERLET